MAALITLIILVIIEKGLRTDAAVNAKFPIGGLFNRYTLEKSRTAFESIGTTVSATRAYHGRVIYPSVTDSYSTALEVCQNTADNQGIVALIDARPTEGVCDNVCLLCNRLNITHLSLGWEPTDTMNQDLFTFSYYPPPELISKAYATLIKDLQWDKFSILYEDDASFIRLQEIINTWPKNNEPIVFRKLIPKGDNRMTLKNVFKEAGINYHVLDCHVDNILDYLDEVTQIENATQYKSFILTALDAHTINFKKIPNLESNVSTLHITAAKDVGWSDIDVTTDKERRMETALAVDALTHLEKAIRAMLSKTVVDEDGMEIPLQQKFDEPPALCYKDTKAEYEEIAWTSGSDLRTALIETTARGFTGNIQFDEEGKRTNFQLHYSKLNDNGDIVYVGYWNSISDIIVQVKKVDDRSTKRRTGILNVVSKENLPYFTVELDSNGTEVKRGYAVDLVTKIVEIMNKNGTQLTPYFYKVRDNKLGNPIEGSKKWDGMMGELMEHNADLAVCDITITSDRNEVVDFSLPFMTTGISMLFKEPEPEEPRQFSFLQPLALDVWLYLATTYIIVSCVLLVCARMSRHDWVNPHPCNQNPENLENIWSLYNCMWLTMGTIMTQGCDIIPRGFGSRWITGMWYFFAMIVTASYTANMSTFISNSRRSNDIDNVQELSEQNVVGYGAVVNSSTYKFFRDSNITVYAKIWSTMTSARPTVFTNNNDEGKDRVLRSKGKYAFFMESTAIEYYTERDCDLKMVGSELDSKEYGIAMPKNFPYKGQVDSALLALQESGELQALKYKWWKEEDKALNCQSQKDTEKEEDSGSLQMKNTSGIFVVLGVGGILGLIVALVDFMLHARNVSVKENVTFKDALASEWRASFNPRGLQKPVAPPRSAPPSESPSSKRERSQSRAVSVLRAATSFINFDEIY